jgi:hypothetical protein
MSILALPMKKTHDHRAKGNAQRNYKHRPDKKAQPVKSLLLPWDNIDKTKYNQYAQ